MIDHGVLFLRSIAPREQRYPFMHFNKPGFDLEKSANGEINYILSSLKIKCHSSTPVFIKLLTSDNNENKKEQKQVDEGGHPTVRH